MSFENHLKLSELVLVVLIEFHLLVYSLLVIILLFLFLVYLFIYFYQFLKLSLWDKVLIYFITIKRNYIEVLLAVVI